MSDVRRVNRADVFRGTERVGVLERTNDGCTFSYTDAFFASHRETPGGIARQFPWATQRFEQRGDNLHAFFAGLLPEGLRLKAIVDGLKTSESDLFSLLLATGSDTVGDIAVVAEGEQPTDAATLNATPSAETFRELWARSLATTRFGPTVGGVQNKLSPGTMPLPITGLSRRKAYLLKLTPEHLPRLVENEFFFMRCAHACGLKVAKCELVHDREGERALLVERFDRRWHRETKTLERLHQEDVCQLLNRFPQDKYRLGCAQVSEALEACTAPVVARALFIERLAFSYVIGNGDLHARNVSVTQGNAGLAMSPGYDLLTTLPYGDRRMALEFEGRDDHFKRHDFVAFGERHGVAAAWTEKRLSQLTAKLAPWLAKLGDIGLEASRTADLERVMTKRLADLD